MQQGGMGSKVATITWRHHLRTIPYVAFRTTATKTDKRRSAQEPIFLSHGPNFNQNSLKKAYELALYLSMWLAGCTLPIPVIQFTFVYQTTQHSHEPCYLVPWLIWPYLFEITLISKVTEKGRPFQIEDTHYKLFPIKCMSLLVSGLNNSFLI